MEISDYVGEYEKNHKEIKSDLKSIVLYLKRQNINTMEELTENSKNDITKITNIRGIGKKRMQIIDNLVKIYNDTDFYK